MNTSIKLSLVSLLLSISLYSFAQKQDKEKGKVFGRIYTGFYHSFDNEVTPQSGFDFTTGILGYSHKLSDKVKAVLLYDVTRTTNIKSITDSSGDTISLNYFEGSKYTAFLKMAQIDWQITPKLLFSVGQLLNEQYLTIQDRWWGFRYVRVTFQEAYRYGMPAFFGARFTYSPIDDLHISFTAVNGEGPFRYQDNNSKFLVSTNIEYYPVKNLILKLYIDREPQPDESIDGNNKYVISGFAAYKSDKIMFGFESNFIRNKSYISDNNFEGYSLYSAYSLFKKLKIIGRLDYGNFSTSENSFYSILGLEYSPEKNFFTSINYRMFNTENYTKNISQLNVNFGIKF